MNKKYKCHSILHEYRRDITINYKRKGKSNKFASYDAETTAQYIDWSWIFTKFVFHCWKTIGVCKLAQNSRFTAGKRFEVWNCHRICVSLLENHLGFKIVTDLSTPKTLIFISIVNDSDTYFVTKKRNFVLPTSACGKVWLCEDQDSDWDENKLWVNLKLWSIWLQKKWAPKFWRVSTKYLKKLSVFSWEDPNNLFQIIYSGRNCYLSSRLLYSFLRLLSYYFICCTVSFAKEGKIIETLGPVW
jgi:hypothetical protein